MPRPLALHSDSCSAAPLLISNVVWRPSQVPSRATTLRQVAYASLALWLLPARLCHSWHCRQSQPAILYFAKKTPAAADCPFPSFVTVAASQVVCSRWPSLFWNAALACLSKPLWLQIGPRLHAYMLNRIIGRRCLIQSNSSAVSLMW